MRARQPLLGLAALRAGSLRVGSRRVGSRRVGSRRVATPRSRPRRDTSPRGASSRAASRWIASLFALLSVAALAVPSSATAQLEAADAAYTTGELAAAGRAYEDAIASGALDPEPLARAHARLAVLAALGAEAARFESHARVAIALGASPPEGLDEAHAARFAALGGEHARLRVVIELSDDASPIGLEVRDAPPGLVRTLVVTGRGGWSRSIAWEDARRELTPPIEARPIEVRALDRHGNLLARAGVSRQDRAPAPSAESTAPGPAESAPVDSPTLPAIALAPEPEPAAETPLIESPWLWVIVGLVVLGVAIGVGVSASGERFVLDAPVIR